MPPKSTVKLEPCPICYGDVPTKLIITCPACDFKFCSPCQKNSAKAECMNCNAEFTYKFVADNLGKKFVKDVVIPAEKLKFASEEKKNHPLYSNIVDIWKKYKEQKAQTRFGKIIDPIIKKVIEELKTSNCVTKYLTDSGIDIFPCPKSECRGFVDKSECNICHTSICMKCRNIITSNPHFCNVYDLITINEIKKTSKPCPNCATPIQKSIGCDHMFCTNCRTHFSWNTLAILNISTNGHYINTARYADNIATGANITRNKDQEDDTPITSNTYKQRFNKDSFQEIVPGKYSFLTKILYTDLETIIYIKNTIFNEINFNIDTINRTLQNNVDYLIGDIDEPTWANKLYKIRKQQQKNTLVANLLHIYITTLNKIISDIFDFIMIKKGLDLYEDVIEDIVDKIRTLIDLTNKSLHSIYEEYGGQKVFITINLNEPRLPSILYGTQEDIDTLIHKYLPTASSSDIIHEEAASASSVPSKRK
jgi:hypothetical protein